MINLIKGVLLFPVYMVINLFDYLRTVYKYYPNKIFREADLRIIFSYLLINPYTLCRRYLKNFPDDQVQKVYGETSFSTLETIAQKVKLSAEHTIYDLGCGRGRAVFWFHAVCGCRAIGVEINPIFVYKARKIRQKMDLNKMEFKYANLLDVDYSNATHIYLYGSALTEEAGLNIIEHFKGLKSGTIVISVTFQLNDFTDEKLFEEEEQFTASFIWGKTPIYILRKL